MNARRTALAVAMLGAVAGPEAVATAFPAPKRKDLQGERDKTEQLYAADQKRERRRLKRLARQATG